MRTRGWREALLALAWSAVSTASAAEGPAMTTGAALSDAEIDRRLRFLEERLERHRVHGQVWYWSWMTVNAGSTVVLGTLAGLADDEDDQVNFGVQAGVAAIGVADLLLRPLEARYGAAPVRDLPEETREQKLVKLRTAEEQLRSNADRAEERTSFAMHAANVGLNAAAGLIIGLAGNPSDGIVAFGSGTAGGVVNILTQPWGPERDWREYRALSAGEGAAAGVGVVVSPLGDGAHLALRVQW
jgi:hypothetical protein